jgi:hypothetical protein
LWGRTIRTLGFSIGNEDDIAIQYAMRAQPIDGFFDVIGHGSPTYMMSQGRRVTPDMLDYVLNAYGEEIGYTGQAIRLVSCWTGAVDDGFAQQLANKMNVKVLGATNEVSPSPDGTLEVLGNGLWRLFSPGGAGSAPFSP